MIDLPHLEYVYRHEGERRSRLVVALSHTARPVFQRRSFDSPFLSVYEPGQTTYFMRAADEAATQLVSWIRQREVSELSFIGGSKGGTGALLWASLAARRAPEVLVTALAFSPRTALQPYDESVPFAGYHALMRRARTEPALAADLARHGRISIPDLDNLFARIVYPSKAADESAQARRVMGPRVELQPLPIRQHSTMFPFSADMSDRAQAAKQVDKLLLAGERNNDLATALDGSSREQLIDEFHALGAQPSLRELLESVESSHPGRARMPVSPGSGTMLETHARIGMGARLRAVAAALNPL